MVIVFFVQDVNVTNPSYESWLSFGSPSFTYNVNWTAVLAYLQGFNPTRSYFPFYCGSVSCGDPVTSISTFNTSRWQSIKIYSDHASNATVTTECTSSVTGITYIHYSKLGCQFSPSTNFNYWLVSPFSNASALGVPSNEEWNTSLYNCSTTVTGENATLPTLLVNFTYNEVTPNAWNEPPTSGFNQSNATFEQKCAQLNTSGGIVMYNGSYCFGYQIVTPQQSMMNYSIDNQGNLIFSFNWTNYWNSVCASGGEDGGYYNPVVTIASNFAPISDLNITADCVIQPTNRSLPLAISESYFPPWCNLNDGGLCPLHSDDYVFAGAFNFKELSPIINPDETTSSYDCVISVQDSVGNMVTQHFRYIPTDLTLVNYSWC